MALDPPFPVKDTPSAKRSRTLATTANTTSTAPEEDQNREESIQLENGKRESKGPLSMTLVNPNVLDCSICFEPLSFPVFQCENGHIACASCCNKKLKNKCSNCGLQIGNIRNRALEHIVKSGRVTCQYARYGCNETLSYSKKAGHERACTYAPCSCPIIGCDFVGNFKDLYGHFALKHKDSSRQFHFNDKTYITMDDTHVILREETEGVLFVVNRCVETPGCFYNVICVAPSISEERFSYEFTASIGIGKQHLIKVITPVEMMPKWTQQPSTKMNLMIPSYFISTDELLILYLIIRKIPACVT